MKLIIKLVIGHVLNFRTTMTTIWKFCLNVYSFQDNFVLDRSFVTGSLPNNKFVGETK